jgi:hypothetical protein
MAIKTAVIQVDLESVGAPLERVYFPLYAWRKARVQIKIYKSSAHFERAMVY